MAQTGANNITGLASSTDSSSSAAAISLVANTNTHQEIARPLENFSPDLWGDRFITLPFTNSKQLMMQHACYHLPI
ncbi:hypothetical protein DITRI_Ditri09bG0057500 [Diplodiscus trichospermus]